MNKYSTGNNRLHFIEIRDLNILESRIMSVVYVLWSTMAQTYFESDNVSLIVL